MVKEVQYIGDVNEKVEEIFENQFGEDFLQTIKKIGEVAGIGELESIDLYTYPFTNKFEITENNAILVFFFQKGRIRIFDGLTWDEYDPIRTFIILTPEGKDINPFSNNELENMYLKFTSGPELGDALYQTYGAIVSLNKTKGIYELDMEVNINKFSDEERETLIKAFKILGVIEEDNGN